MRKTSLGTAGVALSLGSAKSLRGTLVQSSEKPAILGGTPVRTEPFPSWPIYEDQDIELYLEAYNRNRWSEYSNRDTELVVQFEKQYGELMGTKYCVATNAGTTALTAALSVVGVVRAMRSSFPPIPLWPLPRPLLISLYWLSLSTRIPIPS